MNKGGVIKCFAKIKDLFEQLWVFIAPAFSFIGYIFEKIELVALQKIFYMLSIVVLVLGMVELFRNRKVRKIEVFESRAEKTVKLASSPEEQAKDVLRTISVYERMIKTMLQKIKDFFKLVWGNKQALTSIIGSLCFIGLSQYALYSDILKQWEFFNQNTLALQIAGGVLTLLFLINLIYTIANKYGLESLSQINSRLAEVKAKKESKLTKEQKATIKKQYDLCKNELNKAKSAVCKFEKDIENFKVLSNVPGILVDDETRVNYDNAVIGLNPAKLKVENLEKQTEVLKGTLKK